MTRRTEFTIAALSGDGVGAELMAEASRALAAVSRLHGFEVDLVLTPTLPIVPPPLRRGVAPGDLDVREALIRFTYPFSSLGWPALALPCGETSRLPVSLQLAGRAGADGLVLAAGALLAPFEGRPRPPSGRRR